MWISINASPWTRKGVPWHKHLSLVVRPKNCENSKKNIFDLTVVLELKVKIWPNFTKQSTLYVIQSYPSMSIIKIGLLFQYPSMKKIKKIRLIFDIEKWLWMSELCCFWPLILNRPKAKNNFSVVFIVHWPYLLTNKLRCLKKQKVHSMADIHRQDLSLWCIWLCPNGP